MWTGYCNNDQAGSEDDMRCTSGNAFRFGSRVFSWASKNQCSIALSIAEAEYVSAAEATTQAIWLIFIQLTLEKNKLKLHLCYVITHQPLPYLRIQFSTKKTRYINRGYHYIRDAIQDGTIDQIYCKTEDQLANIFTRALAKSSI